MSKARDVLRAVRSFIRPQVKPVWEAVLPAASAVDFSAMGMVGSTARHMSSTAADVKFVRKPGQDLVVMGENEGAGADPQIFTVNGGDYPSSVRIIAQKSGKYLVQRHLTRGSCGPTIEEMSMEDITKYLRKISAAATAAGQLFTVKGFNAQNQYDELDELARVCGGLGVQFETVVCYSEKNSDEYMQRKINEAVEFTYRHKGTCASIKSMIGDLTPENAAKYARMLKEAINRVYAVEIAELVAAGYSPSQLAEVTDVTRDRYQSIAGNQLNPADPLILSAVAIRGALATKQVEKGCKTIAPLPSTGVPLPKAALHTHNPTGRADEANLEFAKVFFADGTNIIVPVVDVIHAVAPEKVAADWQNFGSYDAFLEGVARMTGLDSVVSRRTGAQLAAMTAYGRLCDAGNQAAFIADDPSFCLPNEVAAILGVPGGGKSHTITAFKKLAGELNISLDQMVAQYIRAYALVRGVDINKIYAAEISDPVKAAKFEEIKELMRTVDLSSLEALAPEGIFPGLSTVTPDHANADHTCDRIARGLKEGSSGLGLLAGIKPKTLNLMRKNDFPGGSMSDDIFNHVCQGWMAAQLAPSQPLLLMLEDELSTEEEIRDTVAYLTSNAHDKSKVKTFLEVLEIDEEVGEAIVSEAGRREYILTSKAVPKYEEHKKQLADHAKEHGGSYDAMHALIVDTPTAMMNGSNPRVCDPFGFATREEFLAERMRQFAARMARTSPSATAPIDPTLLNPSLVSGTHIDGDALSDEEAHNLAVQVAPGLVQCPAKYSQFVVEAAARSPELAFLLNPDLGKRASKINAECIAELLQNPSLLVEGDGPTVELLDDEGNVVETLGSWQSRAAKGVAKPEDVTLEF